MSTITGVSVEVQSVAILPSVDKETQMFVVETVVPRGIRVGEGKYGKGLFATEPFKSGQLMYKGHSVLGSASHEFFINQITHADGSVERIQCSTVHSVLRDDKTRQFYGFDGYMNHSCDPNNHCPVKEETTDLQGYDAMCIKDIAVGDEITCDYALLDWDCDGHVIEACGCGSSSCRGSMRGFRHLHLAEQVRLLHLCDPSLVEKFKANYPDALYFVSELPDGVAIEGRIGGTDRAASLIATKDFPNGAEIFTNKVVLLSYSELDKANNLVILQIDGKHCLLDRLEHMIHRPGDRAEMVGFDTFMDHSCEPSTRRVYVTKDTYTVFAARDVKAGEKLTTQPSADGGFQVKYEVKQPEFGVGLFAKQFMETKETDAEKEDSTPTTQSLADGGFQVKYEVKQAEFGLGLFAKQFIPAGTLVWKATDGNTVFYKDAEAVYKHLETMETDAEKKDFLSHAYPSKGGEGMCQIFDDDRFTNHSDDPNMQNGKDASSPEDVYAIKDIQEGEEMRENYGTWPWPESFFRIMDEYEIPRDYFTLQVPIAC